MLISSHLHGHDIGTIIYNGFCEIVKNHYHSIFLLFFINKKTKDFWAITEILDYQDGHSHSCHLTEDEIKLFIQNREVTITSSQYGKDGHQHKIFFNTDQKQKPITQEMVDKIIFEEA